MTTNDLESVVSDNEGLAIHTCSSILDRMELSATQMERVLDYLRQRFVSAKSDKELWMYLAEVAAKIEKDIELAVREAERGQGNIAVARANGWRHAYRQALKQNGDENQ